MAMVREMKRIIHAQFKRLKNVYPAVACVTLEHDVFE